MKHMVRPAVLIVAAMVGSAVVVLALVGMTKSLSQFSSSPADFLAAPDVAMLLHNPTPSLSERWGITHQTDAIALAKLETEAELTGEVRFFTTDKDAAYTLGRYQVELSDPLLKPLLGSQVSPLQKQAQYANFHKVVPKESAWAFVKASLLTPAKSVGTRIAQHVLLGTDEFFAYAEHEGSTTFFKTQPQKPWQQTLLVPAVEDRVFAMSYTNAKEDWGQLLNTLTRNDASILEGLVRAYINKLGASVSLNGDILELMAEPGSLQWANVEGVAHPLLAGSHLKKIELNAILNRLHTAYAESLPTTRVTRRVLDNRFSTTDLRHDESVIVHDEQQHGAYWVTTTRHADQPDGLHTAVHEGNFLVSTNLDLLLSALQEPEPLLSTPRQGTRTVEIWADLPALANTLKLALPQESELLSRLGDQTLFFFSEWQGNVQSQTIELSENMPQLLDSLL